MAFSKPAHDLLEELDSSDECERKMQEIEDEIFTKFITEHILNKEGHTIIHKRQRIIKDYVTIS